MVTIKRASSGLSPRAFRKCEMYCVRFPSSTNVSPHTACSSSSLVTKRLGFCTRKVRTSNALGVRKTGESALDKVRLRESSRNCPKWYKLPCAKVDSLSLPRLRDVRAILKVFQLSLDPVLISSQSRPHRFAPAKNQRQEHFLAKLLERSTWLLMVHAVPRSSKLKRS